MRVSTALRSSLMDAVACHKHEHKRCTDKPCTKHTQRRVSERCKQHQNTKRQQQEHTNHTQASTNTQSQLGTQTHKQASTSTHTHKPTPTRTIHTRTKQTHKQNTQNTHTHTQKDGNARGQHKPRERVPISTGIPLATTPTTINSFLGIRPPTANKIEQ